MESLADSLLQYGVLGLWVAYMIYRDVRLHQRLKELEEAHYKERQFYYNEIKDRLTKLLPLVERLPGTKTLYDVVLPNNRYNRER